MAAQGIGQDQDDEQASPAFPDGLPPAFPHHSNEEDEEDELDEEEEGIDDEEVAATATDAPKEEEEEDGEGNKMDSSGIESMNLSANAEAEGSSRKVRKKLFF